MRGLLLLHGWLLILAGVACAVAAPRVKPSLIELSAVAAAAVLQTGGIAAVALAYTHRRCAPPRSAAVSGRMSLDLGASERCIGDVA